MPAKIRLGVIGANVNANWAPRSHFPALGASADFELTAVCTTKARSAEEARTKYGARLAFDDYRAMVASPEIDAVAVVVRVPSHYEPTKAAIEAGKHVYTEWPLGRTTAEGVELAALAKARSLVTVVGLQARVDPAVMYMKDQIAAGYVGDVLSCHVSLQREGVLQRNSTRTWQRDVTLGANTLTIAAGHTIDAMRFALGELSEMACVVSTQARQWLETDTQRMLDVTSPDNVLVSARLASGAVASVHVAAVPWVGAGYRMEVYGSKGTLVATCEDSPQLSAVHLQGAQGNSPLADLAVPSRYVYVAPQTPKGSPINVGQMYCRWANAIRTGRGDHPTFDTAVELHKLIDAIQRSSDTGKMVRPT